MTDASQSPDNPRDRIVELGKRLFELKALKAEYEQKVKDCESEIHDIAQRKLPRIMQDSEVENIKIKDLGTLYVANDIYVNVNKDDRPKVYEWLRQNGHSDLVQDYVFPQTLTAFTREQLGKGEALPEQIQFSHIPTAKTRRA